MAIKPNNLIRACGNCKREFIYKSVIEKYPEPLHNRITQLWADSQIRFYCPYCYLLKLIKQIKKN